MQPLHRKLPNKQQELTELSLKCSKQKPERNVVDEKYRPARGTPEEEGGDTQKA
jgi:hypothetical protein